MNNEELTKQTECELCKACKYFNGDFCEVGHICINASEFVDAGYGEEYENR